MAELLGNYVDSMRGLARRTAEMHIALSSRPDVPAFAPEPFTEFYRHSVYHGMLGQLNRAFDSLRSNLRTLPAIAQEKISEVLSREGEVRSQLLQLRDKRLSGLRIRLHGDLHLSNVLFSGSDWMITNFEGDPYRSLSERRIKRSAMRDVATMLRSFHYVSHAALFGDVPGIVPSKEAHPQLEMWAEAWYRWVSSIFLQEYLKAAGNAAFLPQREDEFRILLASYMLERALIEIEHELDYRPEWIRIPVHGILEQLKPVPVLG
jgi:maltose alpha-D-glucosyltransferase/alpha-amylase